MVWIFRAHHHESGLYLGFDLVTLRHSGGLKSDLQQYALPPLALYTITSCQFGECIQEPQLFHIQPTVTHTLDQFRSTHCDHVYNFLLTPSSLLVLFISSLYLFSCSP